MLSVPTQFIKRHCKSAKLSCSLFGHCRGPAFGQDDRVNFIVMIDGHCYQYFPLGMRDYHGDDEEGVDDTHVRGNTDQPCDKAKPNHGDNLGGQNCHFLSQRPFLFLLVACLRLESWRVKDVLKAGKAECAGWLALVDWSRRKRRRRSRWGACALVPVGRVVEKPSHAGQVNRATTVRHFFPPDFFSPGSILSTLLFNHP